LMPPCHLAEPDVVGMCRSLLWLHWLSIAACTADRRTLAASMRQSDVAALSRYGLRQSLKHGQRATS